MRINEVIHPNQHLQSSTLALQSSINEARAHIDRYKPKMRGMLGVWRYILFNLTPEERQRTFLHFSREYADKVGLNPNPNYIRRFNSELRGIWCWPIDYQGDYGQNFPYVHLITVKPDTKTVIFDPSSIDIDSKVSGFQLNLRFRKQGYGVVHDPKDKRYVILGTEFIEKIRSFTVDQVPKNINVGIDDLGGAEYYYPDYYKTAKLQKYYSFLKKYPNLAKKLNLVVNDSDKSVSFSRYGMELSPSIIKATELVLYSIANKKYPNRDGIAAIKDVDHRYNREQDTDTFYRILNSFFPDQRFKPYGRFLLRPQVVPHSSLR